MDASTTLLNENVEPPRVPDEMPQSKRLLIGSYHSNPIGRIIHNSNRQMAFDMIHNLNEFTQILLSYNNDSFIFNEFENAFSFGKATAHRFGFTLRIKTSSHNKNHGVHYKYTCCSREGHPPIHGSLSRPDAHPKRFSQSQRCGCPFVCRLIGIEMSKMPSNFVSAIASQIYQTQPAIASPIYEDQSEQHLNLEHLWYWDQYERCGSHNHSLAKSNFDYGQSSSTDNIQLSNINFSLNGFLTDDDSTPTSLNLMNQEVDFSSNVRLSSFSNLSQPLLQKALPVEPEIELMSLPADQHLHSSWSWWHPKSNFRF